MAPHLLTDASGYRCTCSTLMERTRKISIERVSCLCPPRTMLAAFVGLSAAREISIADFGAIASDPSVATGQRNMAAANAALGNASRGDTVLIPRGRHAARRGHPARDRGL